MWELPGRVVVEVERAEGLRSVQKAQLLFGKQDPYVRGALVHGSDEQLQSALVRHASGRWTSKVTRRAPSAAHEDKSAAQIAAACTTVWQRTRAIKHGGTQPVWEACEPDEWGRTNKLEFRHPGRDPASGSATRMLLCVMDEESLQPDREIGSAIFDLEAILAAAKPDGPPDGAALRRVKSLVTLEDGAGQIRVSIEFEPWPALCARGVVHINVKSAKGLSRVSSVGNEDPYVLAELAPWGLRGRSETLRKGGLNPVWDNGAGAIVLPFAGLLNKGAADIKAGLGLFLSVFDKEYIQRDRCIGRATVDIASLVERAMMRIGRAADECRPGGTPRASDGQPAPEAACANAAETLTLPLWDGTLGVRRSGELVVEMEFQPLFSNEESGPHAAGGGDDGGGTKRALLIGINYEGKEGTLRGCHNDVYEMQSMLQNEFGVEHVSMLLDTKGAEQAELPTANNIKAGIKRLVQGAQPGDRLFLHYSGHGTQVADEDGDEDDGKDETLVPLDFDWNDPDTFVTDDWMRSNFFECIPKGVDLTVCFDCCHSGTLADNLKGMPSTRSAKQKPAAAPVPLASSSDGTLDDSVRSRFLPPIEAVLLRIEELRKTRAASRGGLLGGARSAFTGASRRARAISKAKDGGAITVISGCRDDQTAADAHNDGKFIGALTWSIRKAMKATPRLTLKELGSAVQAICKAKRYTQVPQLHFGTAKSPSSVWLGAWGAHGSSPPDLADALLATGGDEALPGEQQAASLNEATAGIAQALSRTVAAVGTSGSELHPAGGKDENVGDSDEYAASGKEEDDSDAAEDDLDHVQDSAGPCSSGRDSETRPQDPAQIRGSKAAAELLGPAGKPKGHVAAELEECSPSGTASSANWEATLGSGSAPIAGGQRALGALERRKLLFSKSRVRAQSGAVASSRDQTRRASRRLNQHSQVPASTTFANQTSKSAAGGRKLRLRPGRSSKVGTAADDGSGGSRNFLDRMDAIVDSREEALRRRREKEAYEALVDKKACPKCGLEQSYEEVNKRQSRCQQCGELYAARVSWANVKDDFLRRHSTVEAAPASYRRGSRGNQSCSS